MIDFYIVSKKFFLKHKELFDARVASMTKRRIWFFSTHSVKMNSEYGMHD